jgi:hypothetical protein
MRRALWEVAMGGGLDEDADPCWMETNMYEVLDKVVTG